MGEHPATPIDEVGEQLVFRTGEADGLALDEDLAAAEVDGEAVAPVDPPLFVVLHGLRADGVETRDKLTGVVGLGEEALDSDIQRLCGVLVGGVGCSDDDRRV